MRNAKLIIALVALMLLIASCGGKSAEEELLEQIIESSGEDIGDVQINTDGDGNVSMNVEGDDGESVNINTSGDGDDINIVVEGDDGEEMTITGSGDDEEMTITVEGEDGGSMTIGGGDVPEDFGVPVAEGGEVIMSMLMDEGGTVTLIYPASAYDELVAFYTSQLPSGDNVMKSESTYEDGDGTHRNTLWVGDTFMVSIDDCIGMESNTLDSVCTTLTDFGS